MEQPIDPPITHDMVATEIAARHGEPSHADISIEIVSRRLSGQIRLSEMSTLELFAFDTMLSVRELTTGLQEMGNSMQGLMESGGGVAGLLGLGKKKPRG